jgi:hypothetical protein
MLSRASLPALLRRPEKGGRPARRPGIDARDSLQHARGSHVERPPQRALFRLHDYLFLARNLVESHLGDTLQVTLIRCFYKVSPSIRLDPALLTCRPS